MALLDLFNMKYPSTDFHELNLDWCISAVLQLQKAFEDFSAGNKLIFADPLQHDLTNTYAKNTIVVDPVSGSAYLSLDTVPKGVQLDNTNYWLPVFDFAGYVTRANQNFTDNYFSGTDRTPIPLVVGDWVVLDDVLYKVAVAMAADDLFIIGTNIVHFTVEQFLNDFIATVNNTLYQYSLTIQQYKNDIDASELAYRQQLAQDIANTTASLQAQLNAAISGATVDSEVINARVGDDGVTYPTLGDAIRTQFSDVKKSLMLYPFVVPMDTIMVKSGTTNVVYKLKQNGVKLLLIDAYDTEDYYISILYSFDSNTHKSIIQVKNESQTVSYTYQSAARSSTSDLTEETVNLTDSNGIVRGIAIIDWSKINYSYGWGLSFADFQISENCIIRKQSSINANDISATKSTLFLYPFFTSIDNILVKSGTTNEVYYLGLNGVEKLEIEAFDDDPYYIAQLYSYHSDTHKSSIIIKNKSNTVTYQYYSEAWSSPGDRTTETFNLTDSNGEIHGTATINWRLINMAYGWGLDFDNFQILESCIIRKTDITAIKPPARIETSGTGTSLQLLPPSVKFDVMVGFYATFTTFDSIKIGQGSTNYGNCYLEITNTELITHRYTDSDTVTSRQSHSLTLGTFIQVILNIKYGYVADVIINTLGGSFKSDEFMWYGSEPNLYEVNNGSTVITKSVLSWSGNSLSKPIWIFGDSYLDMYPSYLHDWKYDNAMFDGFSGRGSSDALASLKKSLAIKKPSIIVWQMGMNDRDNADSINATWAQVSSELEDICVENDIKLIYCTIPTTNDRNNVFKNTYIRSSGYQYIDVEYAVSGTFNSPTWYTGLLSVDDVHPTLLGRQVIAAYIAENLPQIKT